MRGFIEVTAKEGCKVYVNAESITVFGPRGWHQKEKFVLAGSFVTTLGGNTIQLQESIEDLIEIIHDAGEAT